MEDFKMYFLDELSRSVPRTPRPRLSPNHGGPKFHELKSGQVHSHLDRNSRGMHYYMRYTLTVASIFGVFPIKGLLNKNLAKLRFQWLSLVTFYSLCLLTGFLSIEIIALDYTIRNLNEDSLTAKGGIKKATSGSIFYGNACVAMVLFIRLARRWPQLVQDWRLVEVSLARFGRPRLGWRFSLMTTILFGLAFFEHGLHNWLNTRPGGRDDISSMSATLRTPNGANFTIDNSPTFAGYLQRFSLKTHWYLFHEQKVASYNAVKGFLVMWLALSATFLWNFTDLFIILVSASLAVQMRMFTSGLRTARGQIITSNEWREYREAYTLLSLLVKKVDAHINSIIILSVSSNVYFICAQLITEIDSIQHSYFRTLFYMYSTLFLVGRTTVVVMQAAAINDETKRIPTELYLCPQQSYCIETQRFLHEVTSDFVALTGLNMFYITRNFLLGIGGAILTYEIILIQIQNSK